MENRLDLQEELLAIEGVKDAYFQPPASIRMSYPCVVYELSQKKIFYANNFLYRFKNRYTVTIIDSDPDSRISDLILAHFLYCSFDRRYKSGNLYHTVLILYY